MTVTDELLMEQVQEGDERAFEALLSRYEERIFAYICRILGDPDESRDAFQETFLRVFRKAKQFDTRRKFTTWLYTIARNVCFDRLDSKNRRGPDISLESLRDAGVDPTPDIEPDIRTTQPDPLAFAENQELEAAVREAILQLPEAQRDVMLLKEFEHLTYVEIAEVLHCSVGTVKSRFHYAFLSLKSLLSPLAGGYP